MNPYFAGDEFVRRCEGAQRLMRSQGLSALFVTSERNLYYLSGHQAFCPWHSTTRPTILILPAAGDPVLLAHEVWKGAAIRDTWIGDVRGYTELAGVPTELLVALLREKGLAGERIGAELGLEQRLGMPESDFRALQAALPAAEWLDAAPLLWRMRMVKSPAELACMRKAGAITMHAFQSVFSRLAPGMTQEWVVHALGAAIEAGGADVGFISGSFDADTYLALSCLPSAQPLRAGDLVFADMGAVYHGYWADFSRAGSIGRPAESAARTWESVHRVTMKGVETMRPGVPMGDVVRACAAEAERLGVNLKFAAGRIGHSIGLMLTEPPSLTLDERTPLEAGMTITIEPGIVNREGVFVVEQNVAVTEDGTELLSAGPWEIWAS